MRQVMMQFVGVVFTFCAAICVSFFPVSALAQTQHIASDPSGNPVFILDIYDKGERPEPEDPDSEPATHTLGDKEKQVLTRAASYWAERLSALGSQLPVFIDVTTYEDDNASASSPPSDDPAYTTLLQQGLLYGHSSEALGIIFIGNGIGGIGWAQDTAFSSLPLNGRESDLFSTMVHEIVHALGINSSAYEETTFASEGFNLWDKHLYDHRGIQAVAGMDIALPGSVPADNEFDLSNGNLPYFSGTHVAEMLNGASIKVVDTSGALTGQVVPGIPVNAVETKAELSHMELKNGLMSHQAYSNYSTLMELELAALQDIGYTIDRRNFYGASIYDNDLTIDNTQGYFLRNADGSAYIEGQYNTATYGTGLHIYGSGNTATQRADLLSGGLAGTGIRVDGEANTVIIAAGTRVHANGPYGTGLLVAYGKDHTLVHQGQIEAVGAQGIGARFDFGSANNGNIIEYRGSYINTYFEADIALLPELEGALVNHFAVSGSLSGAQAAMYISDNALVENVDILRGAQLRGNIISHWDKDNLLLQYVGDRNDLVTTLSFGRATGSDGMATSDADSLFSLSYDGIISGPKGMHMQLVGGQLAFNGTADVISVATAAGSTLSGNANYIVSEGFFNEGILAPGNSLGAIHIKGDYTQAGSGQLRIEFDGAGHTDQLIVTGSVTGSGALVFSPVPSFYTGTLSFSQDAFLQTEGTNSLNALNFSSTDVIAPQSPTLSMNMTLSTGPNPIFAVSTQRAPRAYSRYARSSTAAPVGDALWDLADSAQGDMQHLLTSLDFSAMDGSTVGRALPQLSPAIYASAAQASINTGHMLSNLLTAHMRGTLRTRSSLDAGDTNSASNTGLASADQGWKTFVSPYGASSHQSAQGSQLNYTSSDVGLLGGLERTFDHGLLVGAHVAFNMGRLDASDGIDAQNDNKALYVGIQSLYNPQEWGGGYAYGLLRGGVENNRMKRSVSIDAYNRNNRLEWTGLSVGAVLGGGYDWQMGSWNFGPTVNLEYGMVHRPSLTETDGSATRLHLQAAKTHSLRSAAGASVDWNTKLDEKFDLQAQFSALWLHELLDDTQKTDASFADYGRYQFTTKTRTPGRDSLGLQAGLNLTVNENTRVSAQVGTELFRSGYSTIQGNLSLSWEF